MRYLLDTNIVSDLVRNPAGHVTQRIRAVGESAICTSVIVAAALRYGAAKRNSGRLTAPVEKMLGALEVCPLEPPADRIYGVLRSRLEQAGRTIGGNALLIAAHTLALGTVLVSDNGREFSRTDGLRLENWIARET